MSRILAIANQKGGVGKTTTCVNLAASLCALEQKVLLIDLDPQGNATMGSGVNKHEVLASINEVLLGEIDIMTAIVGTQAAYDIVPSNSDLTVAEISLLQKDDREHALAQILQPLKDTYDYILLDCPPSLNMLTINSLVAADGVLIPMQCEYYALEGLSGLIDTVNSVKQNANPKLEVDGLLRTLFDSRNSLSTQVSDQLLSHFNEVVYDAIIPRNVRLAEAPSHGLPGLLYDRYSAGAVAYLNFAQEMLQRHGKNVKNNPLQMLKRRSNLEESAEV
jgi:chromosome partitioning protein